MSRSAWNSPSPLLTLDSSIMTSELAALRLGAAAAVLMRACSPSSAMAFLQPGLEVLAIFRHEEAETEVDQRDEQINFPEGAAPRRILERRLGGVQQVE